MPRSFALLARRHAEYVASDVASTSSRPEPSIASSAACFTSLAMLSPNMTTAGLRMPAELGAFHAPWLSTSTTARLPSARIGGAARQLGHAGYRKVVYGASGRSTSPSGLVRNP